MMRPRGKPPMPSARSSERLPVEMASTCMVTFCPSFMIAPLPNCFSICESAVSSAVFFASPVFLVGEGVCFFSAICFLRSAGRLASLCVDDFFGIPPERRMGHTWRRPLSQRPRAFFRCKPPLRAFLDAKPCPHAFRLPPAAYSIPQSMSDNTAFYGSVSPVSLSSPLKYRVYTKGFGAGRPCRWILPVNLLGNLYYTATPRSGRNNKEQTK